MNILNTMSKGKAVKKRPFDLLKEALGNDKEGLAMLEDVMSDVQLLILKAFIESGLKKEDGLAFAQGFRAGAKLVMNGLYVDWANDG